MAARDCLRWLILSVFIIKIRKYKFIVYHVYKNISSPKNCLHKTRYPVNLSRYLKHTSSVINNLRFLHDTLQRADKIQMSWVFLDIVVSVFGRSELNHKGMRNSALMETISSAYKAINGGEKTWGYR